MHTFLKGVCLVIFIVLILAKVFRERILAHVLRGGDQHMAKGKKTKKPKKKKPVY